MGDWDVVSQKPLPGDWDVVSHEEEQPPTGSLWENIKSIPGGLLRGFSDTASAMGQAAQVEMGRDVNAPSGAATEQALQKNVTGPLPNEGIYGRRIGEALGSPATYIQPGGPLVGAGLGVLSGAGQAAGEQIGGPTGGLVGGIAAPMIAGAGFTGVANRMARSAQREALSVDALKDAADQNYLNARGYGVELHPFPVAGLASQIESDLWNLGYRDRNVPKTFSAIDELYDLANNRTVPIDDIDSVRKVFRRAGDNPMERAEIAASSQAISTIDNFMAGISPADAAINGHFADRVGQELSDARGNWAAARRLEGLETKQEKALDIAGSTYTGGNLNNAVRQQMRQILSSPRQQRGFSDAELDQMRRVVRGSPAGNIARLVGRLLAVRGPVSLGVGVGLQAATGIPIGATAAIGEASKRLGEATTAADVARLNAMTAARSPLGRSIPPPRLQPWSRVPIYGAIPAIRIPQEQQ